MVGRRVPTDRALATELVVRVTDPPLARGPEADTVVLVAVPREGSPRARYLSWIVGYGDLDLAHELEPGRWTIVEPPEPYKTRVDWQPYGWGPLELVWTLPPLHERRAATTNGNGKAVGAFQPLAPAQLGRRRRNPR